MQVAVDMGVSRRMGLVLGLVVVGCSGASTPEIPPATDRSETLPSAGARPAESAPDKAPANETPAPPEKKDPRPGANECAVEVEANDTAEQATPFTRCITGKLASSRDTDVLRIVAPAGAETMIIEHDEAEGRVQYRVSRDDGLPINLGGASFTDEAPPIRVQPGAAYLFELTFARGGSKSERPYEIEVSFE